MRNPFRRRIETAAPTLRERAADLRASLRPASVSPAPLPEPGSAEAVRAWEAACREHSERTSALLRRSELARPDGGVWTTDTLSEALDLGAIAPAEFARLYPMASEFELSLNRISHDLNVHALFALAHAKEFPKEHEVEAIDAEAASFPTVPTGLADACLWAVRHRAWIDGELKASDWSDERFDAESAKTNAVFARAVNEPSTNLREITAKAALALEDFERFTLLPGRKLDDGTRIVHTVLREIVGVGQEAGASAAFTSPNDLPAAILDGWATWGATTGFGIDASAEELAPWERASEQRDRLLYAAMALPATPESIPAKALACAWMEWVNVEQPGKPRDAYGPADQLVYDIHATVMARGAQGDAATGRRPIELPLSILVPTVDFAGATVRELWAIREAANLMCEVSNAKIWQGCNRLPDHPSGAARHNEAGKLMRWLSDAMCHVVSEAEKEARRRTPESNDDRKTRLAMLAVSVIDNDDPAETAAFARELLATVEP